MKWRLMILIVAVATVAAACGEPSSDPDSPSVGALPPDSTSTTGPGDGADAARAGLAPIEGDWILVSGSPIVDGYPITLSASVNDIGGRAACNQYGGSATIDGAAITVGPNLFQTEMACEQDVMDAEFAYLAALVTATEWAIVDGQLQLTTPDGVLVFDRAPVTPTEELIETMWVLDTLVREDMAFTTVGEEATLLLAADGTVSGSTGCRMLTGRWIDTGAEIVFPEFGADGECPDDVWEQDNLVVTVLGDGFTAQIDGDILSLTSMGNEGLVYRAASS